jgi:6-phosphogluconolactonase
MTTAIIVEDASTRTIANWLEMHLQGSLAASSGRVAICLPGGSTPFPILEELTHGPLDWSRIDVWPGDDRVVPEDHPASNSGRIRAVLEPLGAFVVALSADGVPPHFALTWLGMGADGHIASLFPSTDPQPADPLPVRRLTPNPLPPEAPFDRLTLTIPALLNTDEVMFVIRGADKRQVFDAALRGEHDLPVARLLAACDHPVTCFA